MADEKYERAGIVEGVPWILPTPSRPKHSESQQEVNSNRLRNQIGNFVNGSLLSLERLGTGNLSRWESRAFGWTSCIDTKTLHKLHSGVDVSDVSSKAVDLLVRLRDFWARFLIVSLQPGGAICLQILWQLCFASSILVTVGLALPTSRGQDYPLAVTCILLI